MGKICLFIASLFVVVSCSSSSTSPTPVSVIPPATPTTTTGEAGTSTVPSGGGGNGSDIGTGDQTPSTTSPEVSTPTGELVETTVLTDGWSVKIAGTTLVVPGTDITVELEPVTTDRIDGVLETHGSAITALLARMVSPDWAVGCFATFCTDSAGELDHSWMVDPASIPGFGSSYAAWGIPATLYTATFTAPDDAIVRFAGDIGGGVGVDARVVVGSAFGVTFMPSATWASGEPSTPRSMYDADTPVDAGFEQVPFWAGLTVDEPAAVGLGAEQLTWMSSPTVGCGVSALCVPTELDTTVTVTNAIEALSVCDASGGTARVVARDLTIEITYPFPTHQAGMWNGAGPIFEGRSVSSVKFNGMPPLVEGRQQIRLVALYWSGAAGFTQVDGNLYQVGFDPPTEVNRPADDVVAGLFPNDIWSLCGS